MQRNHISCEKVTKLSSKRNRSVTQYRISSCKNVDLQYRLRVQLFSRKLSNIRRYKRRHALDVWEKQHVCYVCVYICMYVCKPL